ncbi:GSCFA domain-containing protein, partial [Acinetobacter baumannii]
LFGKTHEILSRPTAKPEPPTARSHPYAHLPEHQFWRKAVQQVAAAEVDPVMAPAFTLTPQTRIATAGSCFAQHISQRLKRHGFNYLQTEI